MQLIKSLFCFKGLDNSERYFAISICCLAVFFLFNGVILSSLTAKLILLVLITIVYFAAGIRRCRDSHKRSMTAWLTSIVTFLSFLVIILIPSATSYVLLILPVMASLYLFSLPSFAPQVYVMGYCGPVDLSELSEPVKVERKPLSNRIEPSLFGVTNQQDDELSFYAPSIEPENVEQPATQPPRQASNDLALFIHKWLIANQKIAVAAGIFILFISAVITSLPFINNAMTADSEAQTAEQQAAKPETAVTQRQQLLAMPDEFYLLLDQNEGLIVHWQADLIREGEIWSQASATGDDSCEVIEFNNGDKVRTINVVVEDSGSYYANFSPLDTASVVRSLARRGNFGLCGYNFSLKGSQKALNSNPIYSDYAN
ncbi:hypothetical protein RI845_04875 [Thalassotalea nanhaiensis]|uniref:DUF805 domain-containing protein n=1 Tax=Thalassotalea nanhaiensis TaxID=3065648 RepID=A0ABY9TKX2_9GAMM|nr:hypothetical protein RI845_04875 [Colwelliaceae bacterium SQ345]